ncbi:hypothetical protein OG422_18450 [Streptomyces sp. NBC_01525]|nr:hypothetical protein [Streptomyces benahoarensis]
MAASHLGYAPQRNRGGEQGYDSCRSLEATEMPEAGMDAADSG